MIVRRSLSQAAIELSAQNFRDRYAPEAEAEVDLEPIIEFGVGLTIVPEPHLSRTAGMYGYLSSDGLSIVIDERAMTEWPEVEYQALLAHELAHSVLHRAMLPKEPLRSAVSFVRFHSTLPEFVRMQ